MSYEPPAPIQPVQAAPPPKKRHRVRTIILSVVGVFVVLIALGAALGGGKPANANAGTAANATSGGTTAPAVASTGPHIGQAADDGKFRFVVLKVTHAKRVGDQFLSQTAAGRYTVIWVKVTNISDVPQTLDASAQAVFDQRNRQFSPDDTADIYGNGSGAGSSVFFQSINPGGSVTGRIYFDMPKGDRAVTVVLHDSVLSGGVTVRLSR